MNLLKNKNKDLSYQSQFELINLRLLNGCNNTISVNTNGIALIIIQKVWLAIEARNLPFREVKRIFTNGHPN